MTSKLSSRNGKKRTPPRINPKVYTPEFEGLTHGTPVSIVSERTAGKKGHSYTFLHHVLNTETGDEWLDVRDTTTTNETVRSFRVSEVLPVAPKRKYTRRKSST